MRSPWIPVLGLAALSLAIITAVSFLSPSIEAVQVPLTVTPSEAETTRGLARDTIQTPRLTPFPLPQSPARLGGDTQTVSQTSQQNDVLRLFRLRQRPYGPQTLLPGQYPAQQQASESDQPLHLILKPFGPHRAGIEGTSLYVASLVALLSTSTLAMWLFPMRLGRLRQALCRSRRECLRVAAIGLLGYVVALMLGALLALMVTGIPMAVTLLIALVALTFFGLVAVGLALGRWALKRVNAGPASPLWELVAGMLILFPLSLLPFIGWPLIGLAAIFGFGAVLTTKFGSEEGWVLPAFLD